MDIKAIDSRPLAQSTDENIINISSSYIAITCGSAIAVIPLDDTKTEMVLIGHTDLITQLHFTAPTILLSSSSSSLLSWNLDSARTACAAGRKASSIFVGVGLGGATYISTCKNVILLAVKSDITILDTSSGVTKFLEGHKSNVVFCEMISSSRIISLDVDNNLKVWCLDEKRAISQFQLLTSAQFTAVYYCTDTLYLGSADGQLHMYEPISGTRLKRINIESYLPAIDRSVTPDLECVIYAHGASVTSHLQEDADSEDADINNSVITIFKISSRHDQTDVLSTFPNEPPIDTTVDNILIILLTSGVVQLNSLSLQLLTSTSFTHLAPALPLAYNAQFFVHTDNSYLVYTDLLNRTLTTLHLRKLTKEDQNNISMIQNCVIQPNSPLVCLSHWKKPEDPAPAPKTVTERKKTKAKSSGYSVTAPKREMFKPNTKSDVKKKKVVQKEKYVYPTEPCTPTVQKRRMVVSDKQCSVNCLAYSRDSQHIAVGLSDYSALVLKLPEGNKTVPLVGHKGMVSCVKWNTTGTHAVTTAADKTSRVWDCGSGETVIEIKYSDGNTKNCNKVQFKKDQVSAQFYYIDKFLLLAHNTELCLYKYHIEKQPKSKRVIGRYQAVHTTNLEHNVTTISAANSYFSNLVLCGLGDKSIAVYDYNREDVVLRIPDAHTRTVHCIQTIEGSRYVAHNADTYNLILSCSVCDNTKLWDVRSGQCIRSYGKQSNIKTVPSVSTCVRYVAIPSDEQAVYLYDIRATSNPAKLPADSTLVTHFSPKYPQLATGNTEGIVTFYNDK